jgi:hypothetical protein
MSIATVPMSTATVKVDQARIDRLKEQLRSTPAEVDFERVRIMEEVYEDTAGYQQIIRRARGQCGELGHTVPPQSTIRPRMRSMSASLGSRTTTMTGCT